MSEDRGISAVAARRSCDRLTVARVDEWVAGAQPRARLLYGVGDYAPKASAPDVARHLWRLCRRGFVILLRERRSPEDVAAGYPFNYLAFRTERPWRAGTATAPMAEAAE